MQLQSYTPTVPGILPVAPGLEATSRVFLHGHTTHCWPQGRYPRLRGSDFSAISGAATLDVMGFSLITALWSLLVDCCSLLTTLCSLLTPHSSLLSAHCSLLPVPHNSMATPQSNAVLGKLAGTGSGNRYSTETVQNTCNSNMGRALIIGIWEVGWIKKSTFNTQHREILKAVSWKINVINHVCLVFLCSLLTCGHV